MENPAEAINQYLSAVLTESKARGYKFDESKIDRDYQLSFLDVTTGQMAYETKHLFSKLETRDPERHKLCSSLKSLEVHPMFKIVEGEIEGWEIL